MGQQVPQFISLEKEKECRLKDVYQEYHMRQPDVQRGGSTSQEGGKGNGILGQFYQRLMGGSR